MRIFHIATAEDWRAARRSGSYTTSTLGRTLDEEGFLHAARRDQVAGVFDRYYRGAGKRLVLLTIDTDRLGVPWHEDDVGDDTHPHVYGPLSPDAVVAVTPLNRRGDTESFTTVFFKEVVVRALLTVLAMLLAYAGSRIGARSGTDWGAFVGAVTGFAVGMVLLVVVLRRRA